MRPLPSVAQPPRTQTIVSCASSQFSRKSKRLLVKVLIGVTAPFGGKLRLTLSPETSEPPVRGLGVHLSPTEENTKLANVTPYINSECAPRSRGRFWILDFGFWIEEE